MTVAVGGILLALGLLLAPFSSARAHASPSERIGKIRWGYFITYDPTSLQSLRQHIGDLDYLSPYFHEMDGAGNLRLTSSTTEDHVREVKGLAQTHGVAVLPMVKNSAIQGAFSPVLADPTRRGRAIDNVVALVRDGGYHGIHIDFENISPSDRAHLTAFMAELAGRLRPLDKLVTQALPAKDRETTTGWAGAYDYAALALSNDLVVLMAYGYGTSQPQSTAPFSWVEGSVAFAVSQIPQDKLILGVPWYGYHWNAATGALVGSLRHEQAMALAQGYGAAVQYDEEAQSPHFAYWSGGQRHEVWFENRRSMDAKLDLVFKYGLAGAAGWRMGHEDPAVWGSFNARLGFRTWLLAEGCTARPYHTWILVMNPNERPANIVVTFMKEGGDTVVRRHSVPPTSRFSIFANQVVPDAAFSTLVEADAPIFVERAMYFGHDGHVSAGVNSPSRRWYLPEGYSGPDMDTWILLMNPGPTQARATLTFMKEDGTTVVRSYTLRPTSRLNVFADQAVPDAAFSTLVEADQPIVAERASYFDGGEGGHSSVGAPFASKSWHFAEGYTGFGSYLLLMNPNASSTNATISFMREDGVMSQHRVALLPTSRNTIYVNNFVPNAAFSAKIEAEAPIVAERAMYWGQSISGHSALGVTAPAKRWFLAEGCTAYPFSEWLLVMNPGAQAAQVQVTFMLEGGSKQTRSYSVGGGSRFTLRVADVVPNAAVSLRVDADRPVVVERSMYFGTGGHNAGGVSQ